jgi:secreted trypsin-like serine protease
MRTLALLLCLLPLPLLACVGEIDDGGEPLGDDALGEDQAGIVGPAAQVMTGAEAASAGIVGLVAVNTDGIRTGFCSGVLVAPRLVLTAGHCLNTSRGPVKYAVFATGSGAFDIFVQPRKLIAFDAAPVRATNVDLALLRLAEPAPPSYAKVAVGAARKLPLGSAAITVYGFGRRVAANSQSGGPPQKMAAILTNLEPASAIFYVNSPAKSGLCFGDSGGPAVRQATSGPVVVGVLSSGNANCTGGDIYASTGAGEAWIKSTSTALGQPIVPVPF